MKTSPALPLPLVLFALALLVLLGLSGCRRPFSFFERPASPHSSSSPTATPVAGDLGRLAVDTVGQYLEALHAGDYDAAYVLLSRNSSSQHSQADFTQQAKRGMPNFDIGTARTRVKDDTATVVLSSPEEDAKSHTFHLVLEDGSWKVVYLGGGPGQPYSELDGNKG